jgi:hypothetical protein
LLDIDDAAWLNDDEMPSYTDWPLIFQQARLPPSLGGLGITSLEVLALPAFVASTARCLSVVATTLRLDGNTWQQSSGARAAWTSFSQILQEVSTDGHAQLPSPLRQFFDGRRSALIHDAGLESISSPELFFAAATAHNNFQSSLTHVCLFSCFLRVLQRMHNSTDAGSQLVLARFLSQACPEAAYWHLAPPVIPEYQYDPVLFRSMLAYYMGLPLPIVDSLPEHCTCGSRLDSHGFHLLECSRIYAHDNVVKEVAKFVRAAGCSVLEEPSGILLNSAPKSRPDLLVRHLDGTKRSLVDVTTGSPTAATYLSQAVHSPGSTAARIELRKISQYQDTFAPSSTEFFALGLEIPGRWGPHFLKFFKKVCSKALSHLPYAGRDFSFIWKRRLAVVFKVALFERGLSLGYRAASPARRSELSSWDCVF